MKLQPQLIGLIAAILLLQVAAFCQSEPQYPTKEKRKEFYNNLVEKYAPADIKKIWEFDENYEFDQWVDGPAESELIEDFETVIHETFHGICSTINDGQNYYINKDLTIYVPYTEVYNSILLNKVIRKTTQDSIFRYGLYVGGKNYIAGGSKTNQINSNKHNEAASIVRGIYEENYQQYLD